jgi:hypothetical protein
VSVLKDILAGIQDVIQLNGKVVAVSGAVERMAGDIRKIDRRLVRVETIIEITRPDGSTLRLAPPDDNDDT